MCHLNTARHSGLGERLSRSSPLSSSSSSSQWENERKVEMMEEWTALCYWGCMYFNSSVFVLFFVCFFQCQVLISVLSSAAVVQSFKGWRGKRIGLEADCKYVFLPVAVEVWTLLAKAFLKLLCLISLVGVTDRNLNYCTFNQVAQYHNSVLYLKHITCILVF